MVLLVYKKEIDFIVENEFIIILSIESVKIVEIYGKKEEKIKDIIIENSIKLDFNWCKFKYKVKEIDLEQKFDNIADDDDKKKLKIEITVNYIIPLIVNLINEQNNKYKIQCLLGDKISSKIEPYFYKNHLNSEDYYLVYENKTIENYYYKLFYQIISEDKIKSSFDIDNEQINNTIKSFTESDNLEKTNTTMINEKDKIKVLSNGKINEKKIEIEIKIIKKCCCFIF